MSLAKIGNKIFKKEVELSREGVELGLIDDIDRGVKELKQLEADTIKEINNKWESDLKAGKLISRGDKVEKDINSKITHYISAAKELGISSSKLEKEVDSIISAYKKTKAKRKSM